MEFNGDRDFPTENEVLRDAFAEDGISANIPQFNGFDVFEFRRHKRGSRRDLEQDQIRFDRKRSLWGA